MMFIRNGLLYTQGKFLISNIDYLNSQSKRKRYSRGPRVSETRYLA